MIRSLPLRYFVVGAFNSLLGYSAYCLGLISGLSVPTASLASIAVGIVVSFSGQGLVVFGNVTVGAFFRFVANWTVMYLGYVGVVTGLRYVGVGPYLGGLIAFVPTTMVSYFVLRDHVFTAPAQ